MGDMSTKCKHGAFEAYCELCADAKLLTREQIEEFYKEHHIPDDGKLEPWR